MILRAALARDRLRRVNHVKLQARIGTLSSNEAGVKEVNSYLKAYVDSEYQVTSIIEDQDLKLREEFEAMKDIRLEAVLDRDGNLLVKGLHSNDNA